MVTFTFTRESVQRPTTGLLCRLLADGRPVSADVALDLLSTNTEFLAVWVTHLQECSRVLGSAYTLECRRFCRSSLRKDVFEMVILASPALDAVTRAERGPFASHLEDATERGLSVTSFANLHRDAVLVVPVSAEEPEHFAHLAVFTARAPCKQQMLLWQKAGRAVQQMLATNSSAWLSTSGLAVAWLHVRIDKYPKYYSYRCFREERCA